MRETRDSALFRRLRVFSSASISWSRFPFHLYVMCEDTNALRGQNGGSGPDVTPPPAGANGPAAPLRPSDVRLLHRYGKTMLELYRPLSLPAPPWSSDEEYQQDEGENLSPYNYLIVRLWLWRHVDREAMGPKFAIATTSFHTGNRLANDDPEKRKRQTRQHKKAAQKRVVPTRLARGFDKLHAGFRAHGSGIGGMLDIEHLECAARIEERNAFKAVAALNQVISDYSNCVRVLTDEQGGQFDSPFEIPNGLLVFEGRACGPRQLDEALQAALPAFSPEAMPTLPISVDLAAVPEELRRLLIERSGDAVDLARNRLLLRVPNDPGPIRSEEHLREAVQEFFTFIASTDSQPVREFIPVGPDEEYVDTVATDEKRAQTLEMLLHLRQRYGHLGGTMLLVHGAGKRALNRWNIHGPTIRPYNASMGEDYGILPIIEAIAALIGQVIRGHFARCGLECDDDLLFLLTGANMFLRPILTLDGTELLRDASAVEACIAANRASFERTFSYPAYRGKRAASQIEESLRATRAFSAVLLGRS